MAAIEKTQSVSIESFSYSWLVNLNASFEGLEESFRASLDASDEASFIEMDPKLSPSKRFFRVPKDVNFDFPTSHSPSKEVLHADKLINKGYLMPLFVKPQKMDPHGSPESISAPPISSVNHKEVNSSCKINRSASLRRCRRLSKKLLEKYFDFLRPLCQKMRWDKSVSRPGNSMKKAKVHRHKVKNWECSPANSPRRSVAYSVDNWRRSCDSESSIHEAVLHCKRTIGMQKER